MMNYRKQMGYLKGLCKGLSYEPDTPEAKLIVAIIDTLDAFSSEFENIRDNMEEFEDDLQDISDEIGELESISEDIESLEEQIEALGDTIGEFSSLYGIENNENLIRPVVSRPIRLVTGNEEFEDFDDDDEEEDIELSVTCPKCGERVRVTDENITVD